MDLEVGWELFEDEPADEGLLPPVGRRYRKACKGKVKFPKKGWAVQARNRLYASPYWDGKQLNVYRCPYCYKWHFGHAKERIEQRWESVECLTGEDTFGP
jgi:hypothetical protein